MLLLRENICASGYGPPSKCVGKILALVQSHPVKENTQDNMMTLHSACQIPVELHAWPVAAHCLYLPDKTRNFGSALLCVVISDILLCDCAG